VAQMRESRQSESSLDAGGSQNSSAAAGAPLTDGGLDSQTDGIASSSAEGVVSVAAKAGKIYRRIADVSSPCSVAMFILQSGNSKSAAIHPCKVCIISQHIVLYADTSS